MYKYERVSKESEESLLGNRDDVEDAQTRQMLRQQSFWKTRCVIWIAQLFLFLASCAMFFNGLMMRQQALKNTHDRDFLPQWSPVLDAVKGSGYFQRFDGSFMTPNAYKGTPSPLIDAEWDRALMASGGVISIDEETLHRVNASQEYSVKLSPELGGGYMASVEVLHQLHCLNMLRQATYEDYYKDKAEPWEDSPQILRHHLDHCIDNLRQKLMCEADTGILTYVWVKDHPAPFPDFNVQHKCRNFDAILDWVTEHQTYTPEGSRVERQSGYKEMESPP